MEKNHVRTQRQGQSARQAMMISGLNTIYRNTTSTHHIHSKQRTEPRIYFLDITLDEINAQYSKLYHIIERGRLRPKGTEIYFVTKKIEHFILSDDAIYEIRTHGHGHGHGHGRDGESRSFVLYEYEPVDCANTTISVSDTLPVLLDESYYIIHSREDSKYRSLLSSHHIVIRHVKMVVKTHPKSMNAFVFILNEDETSVLDFYMTTENGVNPLNDRAQCVERVGNDQERLTRTCKDDIISFIDHFKLCS
jgi:hypothetical protein